ncbi:MAG: hypothetical protein PHY62_03100 [Gallionella sp.]|nr:hypothetical protein [Gallionella sp.]
MNINKDVIGEIYSGISTGFRTLLVNDDGSTPDNNLSDLLERAFRLFGTSLTNELNEMNGLSEDIGFNLNMGATASVFAESVAKVCEVQTQLQASPIDRVNVERIAADNGVKYILSLWEGRAITYTLDTRR